MPDPRTGPAWIEYAGAAMVGCCVFCWFLRARRASPLRILPAEVLMRDMKRIGGICGLMPHKTDDDVSSLKANSANLKES